MTRHTRLLLCAVLLLALAVPCLAAKWYKVGTIQGTGPKTGPDFWTKARLVAIEWYTIPLARNDNFIVWLFDYRTGKRLELIANTIGEDYGRSYFDGPGRFFTTVDTHQFFRMIVWEYR
jgi:hypothetical protein